MGEAICPNCKAAVPAAKAEEPKTAGNDKSVKKKG